MPFFAESPYSPKGIKHYDSPPTVPTWSYTQDRFAAAPGGFYDEEMAAKLVKYLFAPRNSIDPAEAYRLFMGRDAKIEALMRDRGFPVTKE